MGFVKQRSLAVVFVSLVLAFALFASNLSAQETTSVSGTITAAYTHEDSIVVGDGHILTLGTSEGKNVNAGEHTFMDGAKIVNMSYSDLARGSGVHQGHILFISDADTVYAQWEGRVTTVLDAEGAPTTSFEGTVWYTAGTGQFVNIKGRGTYKGDFTSETGWSAQWQSRYVIEK